MLKIFLFYLASFQIVCFSAEVAETPLFHVTESRRTHKDTNWINIEQAVSYSSICRLPESRFSRFSVIIIGIHTRIYENEITTLHWQNAHANTAYIKELLMLNHASDRVTVRALESIEHFSKRSTFQRIYRNDAFASKSYCDLGSVTFRNFIYNENYCIYCVRKSAIKVDVHILNSSTLIDAFDFNTIALAFDSWSTT